MQLGRRLASATQVASAAVMFVASSARAQHQGHLAVTGGVATDQRGVRSRAMSVSPSVQAVTGGGAILSAGASLTRFDGQAWSLGADFSAFKRAWLAGPLAMTLDGSASGSRLTAEGAFASFATADIGPTVELHARELVLFAGARAAAGRLTQSESRQLLPGFGGAPSTVHLTRTGTGPSFGATFTQSPMLGALFRVGVREDRLTVAGVRVSDATVSGTVVNSLATFAASYGQRSASDERAAFGSGALSVALTPDVALSIAAGRYPSNRLTGSLAGNFVSAGFTFGNTGVQESSAPGPSARGAPRIGAGYTRFTIDAPKAKRVEIAGDFNNWTPVPAQRAANGVWYADLRLEPGQYRYAFRVDGKAWRVPHGATAVDDGFGGKSAWITVG